MSGGGGSYTPQITQLPYSPQANVNSTVGGTELLNQGTGLQGLFNSYGVNTTPYQTTNLNSSVPYTYPSWMSSDGAALGTGASTGTQQGTGTAANTYTTGYAPVNTSTGATGSSSAPAAGKGGATTASTGLTGGGLSTSGTGYGTTAGASSPLDLSTLTGLMSALGGSGGLPSYQTSLGGAPTNGADVNLLQPTNYTAQQGVNAGQAVQASVLGLPDYAYSALNNFNSGTNTALSNQANSLNFGQTYGQQAAIGAQQAATGALQAASSGAGLVDALSSLGNATQSAAGSTLPYVSQALDAGFDPQGALYNQQLQSLEDSMASQQAASGTAMSPYASMATGQAVQNFNNQWEQQQLANQASGASTANALLNAQTIPAGIESQAANASATNAGSYATSAGSYGTASSAAAQPTSVLDSYLQALTSGATQSQTQGQTASGLLGEFNSGMTGGTSTAMNSANNTLNALSGLTGVGNSAASQQQASVSDALSYLQTAVQASSAQAQADLSSQQMSQQSSAQLGSALGSLGGMMGGK
jgi:hypothetical protein